MTKTHDARPGARITANAGARLRQLALAWRRHLSHVPDDVPGAARPAAGDLRTRLARLVSPGCQARHDRR